MHILLQILSWLGGITGILFLLCVLSAIIISFFNMENKLEEICDFLEERSNSIKEKKEMKRLAEMRKKQKEGRPIAFYSIKEEIKNDNMG